MLWKLFMTIIIIGLSITSLIFPLASIQELKSPLRINIDIAIIFINITLTNNSKEYLISQLPRNYPSYITLDTPQKAIEYTVNYIVIEAPPTLCNELNRYMLMIGKEGPLPNYIKKYLSVTHHKWNWRKAIYVSASAIEEWLAFQVGKYVNVNAKYMLFLINIPWIQIPRVYYVSNQSRSYMGFIAFGGNYPIYFIDLSVIPRPHPGSEYALSNYGLRVNFSTTKPIWDIKSELELTEILKHYISDFVSYVVVDDYVFFPKYSKLYDLNILILNYRDRETNSTLSIDINKLRNILYNLTPYTNWNIDVYNIDGYRYSRIYQLINNSTIADNWIVIEYEDLVKVLVEEHLLNYTYSWNYTYVPCIILVAKRPLYLTHKFELNFTGIATPNGIVISYPGYRCRAIKDGIERVIAHEMGHVLGLSHPFEKIVGNETRIKWLFDWVVSPMSYSPLILGWKGGLFTFDSNKLCIMHWVSIAKELTAMINSGVMNTELEEMYNKSYEYLLKGMCIATHNQSGAISYIIKAYELALKNLENKGITSVSKEKQYITTPQTSSSETHPYNILQETYSNIYIIIMVVTCLCIILYILIRKSSFSK